MTSHSMWCAVTAVFLVCHVIHSLAIPRPQDSWYGGLETQQSQHPDECKTNEDIETLCQLCAKRTKSTIVYPMCCEEREEARSWCERYMNYGRHS